MYNNYQDLKELAHRIREKHSINGARIIPRQMKKICKDEGIDYIDLCVKLKKIKGAYFYTEEEGASVIVKKGLPNDPYVFTLAHELKHHLKDKNSLVACCMENSTREMEVGAEIFAAELIFPDKLFFDTLTGYGIEKGKCDAKNLVILKRESKTTLSYAGLVKKSEFLGFVKAGTFSKVKWKKLEEEIYGIPHYKTMYRNISSKN